MSLRITVIGAGIAGLAAAVSLSQHGHHITILEKSRFATETGAALAIAPNGGHALAALGFSFIRARALKMNYWEGVNGIDLTQLSNEDTSDAETRFGLNQPMRSLHRVDLHKELLRLAEEQGDRVGLRLSNTVVGVDTEKGEVSLESGGVMRADPVVCADGLHSVGRDAVLGRKVGEKRAEYNAFRTLIPTEKVRADQLYQWKQCGDGVTILADTTTAEEKHVSWYGCRGNEVQNVVGIHPARSGQAESQVAIKQLLLDEYKHFDSRVSQFFSHAENLKIWPLVSHDPYEYWTKGQVVLIGDAAHPMLPFSGQAANRAIEDAVALGTLIGDNTTAEQGIPRLAEFQALRYNRASTVPIISSTRIGREAEVADRLKRYVTADNSAPASFKERVEHAYSYDVLAACKKVIASR